MQGATFEWEGREYEYDPKSADWYWAVGIVAVALTIAALLFGSYLLAVLVVIATTALALHAAKHPPVHRFALTEQGLVIDHDLYPYEHLHSFAMLEYIGDDKPPVLSIKTESWFAPHLLIPLREVDVDALYTHLLERIEETEHSHSIVDVVAAWLRF